MTQGTSVFLPYRVLLVPQTTVQIRYVTRRWYLWRSTHSLVLWLAYTTINQVSGSIFRLPQNGFSLPYSLLSFQNIRSENRNRCLCFCAIQCLTLFLWRRKIIYVIDLSVLVLRGYLMWKSYYMFITCSRIYKEKQ